MWPTKTLGARTGLSPPPSASMTGHIPTQSVSWAAKWWSQRSWAGRRRVCTTARFFGTRVVPRERRSWRWSVSITLGSATRPTNTRPRTKIFAASTASSTSGCGRTRASDCRTRRAIRGLAPRRRQRPRARLPRPTPPTGVTKPTCGLLPRVNRTQRAIAVRRSRRPFAPNQAECMPRRAACARP